ncbi:hypothetical protein SLA2020_268230 [Shorea laevis]
MSHPPIDPMMANVGALFEIGLEEVLTWICELLRRARQEINQIPAQVAEARDRRFSRGQRLRRLEGMLARTEEEFAPL